MAQQVAEVLPDLVAEVAHPSLAAISGEGVQAEPTRYLALEPIDLIPYLVRALQEQQRQIEALRAELAPLRTRLAATTAAPGDGDPPRTAP